MSSRKNFFDKQPDVVLLKKLQQLSPEQIAKMAQVDRRYRDLLSCVVNEYSDEKQCARKMADPANKNLVAYACCTKGSVIAQTLVGLNNSREFQNLLADKNLFYALGRGYLTQDDVRYCLASAEKIANRLDVLALLITEQARDFIIKGYIPVRAAIDVGDSDVFDGILSNSAKKGFELGAFVFQDFKSLISGDAQTRLPIVNCIERITKKDCLDLFIKGCLTFRQVSECRDEVALRDLIRQAKANMAQADEKNQQQAQQPRDQGAPPAAPRR